jgi:hypothetical protein
MANTSDQFVPGPAKQHVIEAPERASGHRGDLFSREQSKAALPRGS